jgi:hypothetical protein
MVSGSTSEDCNVMKYAESYSSWMSLSIKAKAVHSVFMGWSTGLRACILGHCQLVTDYEYYICNLLNANCMGARKGLSSKLQHHKLLNNRN